MPVPYCASVFFIFYFFFLHETGQKSHIANRDSPPGTKTNSIVIINLSWLFVSKFVLRLHHFATG